ncbi:hypothetical protein GUITHDRAFT_107566 [Guillardia theta CCMP2712]|uniref:Uncharacterized protein n=1 Tax=Guillardia theta (strain CCMP2712) TaxID=905079 RepID=L1JET5_GUITC|nr:hypothetical protein GUITHDRAFT_107566 [Guillardia theta CCMP2712]EKX46792.1 hypothetical protein GUITHDRAFT_107566 [Guillardia theta CCMP2712]|eukprot:XP_005833772.1 hypothetical protein GUITHDRAFT_107566 [Guillardia theta CCMP2712]
MLSYVFIHAVSVDNYMKSLVGLLVLLSSAGATQWQCSTVGAADGQLGRINTDVFCIQYFQGQDTSYCCDHTGYFCMQSNYTIYNPNHVVQGSFMAGNLTSNVDGSGSDRPTSVKKGICSMDKSRVLGSNSPSGVNECGAGSTDPNDPAYCIVVLEAACLDNGQCGTACGTGSYGGNAQYGYQCMKFGKYNPLSGQPFCFDCPPVCVGGTHEGKYCSTGLNSTVHQNGTLSLGDVARIGGSTFVIEQAVCVSSGGTCKPTTTALVGATTPLQCERTWEGYPDRYLQCKVNPNCDLTKFQNTLYKPQHQDAPTLF